MILIKLFMVTIVSGLISGTIVICFYKWKAFEHYSMYKKKWMPAVCFFCTGFWISIPIIILLLILSGERFDWIYIAAPFGAASISNKVNNDRSQTQ